MGPRGPPRGAKYRKHAICKNLTKHSFVHVFGGLGYENLVEQKLLRPLGMLDSEITLTDKQWKYSVARGINSSGGFAEVSVSLRSHSRSGTQMCFAVR